MQRYQLNRILGMIYIIGGLIIFFSITWRFLLWALLALFGLYLVTYGLKMYGYHAAKITYVFNRWRSKF